MTPPCPYPPPQFVLTRNDFNEVIKELPFLKDRIERNLGQLAMDVHQLPGFVQSEGI